MALGAALARGVEQIGADTLRRLIAEVDDEFLPELAELSWTSAQEMLGHFLEAARDRGEISQDPLPRRVVMLPLMLLRDELLFSDQVDEAAVADIVDTICLPLLCRPAS
ncbi:TetR/AcrR family transcriptional regulator C-terminal ligand-binding domain-containing protein [Prauserella oleivorans]